MANEVRCWDCGQGPVIRTTGVERTYPYRRGCTLPVPDDFEVETCQACKAEFYASGPGKSMEHVRERLKPEHDARQKAHMEYLLEAIQGRARVTAQQIEKVCGLTPTTLDHILGGRKEASETLVSLLELLACYPGAIHWMLKRGDIFDTDYIRTVSNPYKTQTGP